MLSFYSHMNSQSMSSVMSDNWELIEILLDKI